MGSPARPGRSRTASLFSFDRSLGHPVVVGADEAGRGCLAGPLVVAAVRLELGRLRGGPRRALGGLDDSKRLSAAERERLLAAILQHAGGVAVLWASPATIDRDGLHVTNRRLLARAIAALGEGAVCLVDGFPLGDGCREHIAITGGDGRSAAIAAASVVAKASRDRLMAGPIARAHPRFGFERHVGYATPEHREALLAAGPSPLHRLSFRSGAYPPDL